MKAEQRKSILRIGLSLVLAGFISGTWAQVITDENYFISPERTASGKEFALQLLSYTLTCAHKYDHQTVYVGENQIVLSFTVTMDSLVFCPAIYAPYGPGFDVPALEPGEYEVLASIRPLCLVEPPYCGMPEPMPVVVDTLTVVAGNSVKEGWFIQPAKVEADTAFTLRMLSYQYGNCWTSFSHTTAGVQNGNIYLEYVRTTDTSNICFVDLRPHGPSYDMPGLAAGRYPVYAIQRMACEFANPPCMLLVPIVPVLVDTLEVAGSNTEKPLTWIEPERVVPEAGFELALWSYGLNCNSVLTNPQVTVTGKVIYLSYGYMETRMACPDVYMPYSARFQVPGLKEGVYEVYLRPGQSCPGQAFPCSEGVGDAPVGVITASLDPAAINFQNPSLSDASAVVHSGSLLLNLPGYAGPVAAFMYSVSGQPVYTWNGLIIHKQTLPLPQDIRSGVYLLKVSGTQIPVQLMRIMVP